MGRRYNNYQYYIFHNKEIIRDHTRNVQLWSIAEKYDLMLSFDRSNFSMFDYEKTVIASWLLYDCRVFANMMGNLNELFPDFSDDVLRFNGGPKNSRPRTLHFRKPCDV